MNENSRYGVRRRAVLAAAALVAAVGAASLGVAAGATAAGAVSAGHHADRGGRVPALGGMLGDRGRRSASAGTVPGGAGGAGRAGRVPGAGRGTGDTAAAPGGSSAGAATTAASRARDATGTERVGVVDIDTVLGFGAGEAAATGMVLPSGDVLTNNHVVEGSTAIRVTDVVSGRSFPGTVVGTAPGEDVAVVRLSGASGLTPARFATAPVRTGAPVTAVGNAGGAGGVPTATTGAVVALDQQITATDENGENAEQLDGMIQVDADIRAGDSGGPLYSGDAVVGMNTAASSGGRRAGTVGFAIPIGTATAVADRIRGGEISATIHQGTPAFLGIRLGRATDGPATLAGVLDGLPAQAAGLRAGDTVTALGGTPVASAAALSAAIAAHRAGDRVEVGWTDAGGTARTATVTLAGGPAD